MVTPASLAAMKRPLLTSGLSQQLLLNKDYHPSRVSRQDYAFPRRRGDRFFDVQLLNSSTEMIDLPKQTPLQQLSLEETVQNAAARLSCSLNHSATTVPLRRNKDHTELRLFNERLIQYKVALAKAFGFVSPSAARHYMTAVNILDSTESPQNTKKLSKIVFDNACSNCYTVKIPGVTWKIHQVETLKKHNTAQNKKRVSTGCVNAIMGSCAVCGFRYCIAREVPPPKYSEGTASGDITPASLLDPHNAKGFPTLTTAKRSPPKKHRSIRELAYDTVTNVPLQSQLCLEKEMKKNSDRRSTHAKQRTDPRNNSTNERCLLPEDVESIVNRFFSTP